MRTARRPRSIAPAALLPFLIACGGNASAPTEPADPQAAVRRTLQRMVFVMERNSINRLSIDWTAFADSVYAAAPEARTIWQAAPAIRTALRLLGDGHSFFVFPNDASLFVPRRTCTRSSAQAPVGLPDDIGYVRVGGFGGAGAEAIAFADGIVADIRRSDRDGLAGWIVDLRGNGGGNMWPMIAGLGTILGNDTLGWFIDPLGIRSAWSFAEGSAIHRGIVALRVSNPYTLRRPRPRVAVLVDNGVASSGEATFIAFRRRPETRSFGQPTCGLSTANRPFEFDDGSRLLLTVSTMADRERTLFGDQVVPDEVIEGDAAVVARAIAWLRGS